MVGDLQHMDLRAICRGGKVSWVPQKLNLTKAARVPVRWLFDQSPLAQKYGSDLKCSHHRHELRNGPTVLIVRHAMLYAQDSYAIVGTMGC